MREDLEKKLFAIEPKWFNRNDLSKSVMACGFSCGDGWYLLIESLLKLAKDRQDFYKSSIKKTPGKKNPFAPGNFEIVQVKQKLAELRFYYEGVGDEYFSGAVSLARALSRHMCEECGAFGKPREIRAWWSTLCDKHAKECRKRGFRFVPSSVTEPKRKVTKRKK